MNCCVIWARATLGSGEIVACNERQISPSINDPIDYIGESKLFWQSKSFFVDLASLNELLTLAEYLNVSLMDAIVTSINAFCKVVAILHIGWPVTVLTQDTFTDILRMRATPADQLRTLVARPDPGIFNNTLVFLARHSPDDYTNRITRVRVHLSDLSVTMSEVISWRVGMSPEAEQALLREIDRLYEDEMARRRSGEQDD